MTAEVETMAYAGETPWHGLGFKLPEGEVSPSKMLRVAGLDWTVSKHPVGVLPEGKVIDRHFALVRDSDSQFLSMVGKNYNPVQNTEAFEFFAKYCEAGKMTMETAGSLKNGRFVWGLAKFSKGFNLLKSKDQVEGYVLLLSPHEIGFGLLIQCTPIRVVCWNTLNYALGANLRGKGPLVYRMPHQKMFDDEAKDLAEETLGLADAQLKEFKEAATLLSSSPAKEDAVRNYFIEAFNLKNRVEAAANDDRKEPRVIAKLMEAYEQGPGANLKTAKGTWWGAANAVTYVIDHEVGRTRDTALYNAWLGDGAAIKRKAITMAVDCAEAA